MSSKKRKPSEKPGTSQTVVKKKRSESLEKLENGHVKKKRKESLEKPERSNGHVKKKRSESLEKPRTSKMSIEKQRTKSLDSPSLKRCPECRQFLDSGDLKLFPGDPENAEEEFIVLTNPKLSVHIDGDYENDDITQLPQHKITNFCVYDRNTHICPFYSGLIETNVELYFSGVVKPIYEEDPSISGGVFARNLGPINEWWFFGFDRGENAMIGFSTPFAEYILLSPSELYVPYMDMIKEKIYISKAVIELLIEDDEASYEDLLNKLHTIVPPQGSTVFTEELLHHHAQFVVDQIQSFESTANENEPSLIISPCIRTLIELSGVMLGKKRAFKAPVRNRGIKAKKIGYTLATTTPYVRSSFENFFPEQLEKDVSKELSQRRKRCGVCESCQLPDCGKCSFCRDMVKFGGSGRSKQACEQRKCPNMAVYEANENDILIDTLDDEMDMKALSCKYSSRKAKSHEVEIEFVGEPVKEESCRMYYNKAKIKDFFVETGNYILVIPADSSEPMYIAKLISMWETPDGAYYHALWFHRGSETVLGETSNPLEVFGTFDCDDEDMTSIFNKCNVVFKSPKENWSYLGGTEESIEDLNFSLSDDGKTFFYQKWFESTTCRFEDPPPDHLLCLNESFECIGCKREEENEKAKCVALEVLEDSDDCTYFSSGEWLGYNICLGDCVFINPGAYSHNYCKKETKSCSKATKVDEDMYPEAYRKVIGSYVKGSNYDTPEPFKIGYILKIFRGKKKDTMPKVVVKTFYRPENTHRDVSFNYQLDLNLLYWSNEEATVDFSEIKGKCYVVYSGNLIESVEEFTEKGPHRFYFTEAYNSHSLSFEEPPAIAQRIGRIGKGKGKKSKISIKIPDDSDKFIFPSIPKKLKTLDVFAGCGGLSEGLHQSGISETLWAIENEESAAQAFRLNSPNCAVFSEDCNFLLKLIMDGKEKCYKGQKLPQKGDVEMLCGGPPCQGFSGMNRFNSRQYSLFKNSLIVSLLSYCDYYRPKYFLLENVRNFISFKKSMVLKLTLSCLINMGYQCTFGVLQAGNYGVPQTRRRAIILAASPGQLLPMFPEPSHVFSSRSCQLSVVVDDKKYDSNIQWLESAPYRTITVMDCMSDLPEIKNGAKADEMAYSGDPLSHYQRRLRGKLYQPVLRDHICKEMSPLVEVRMRFIPTTPGADWRDLPNIIVDLSDGTHSKKLQYMHHDIKNGKSKNGTLRGVCQCATGKKCDPMDRQFNTLIPWCLPHTGNRHNHWAGLYGRLQCDGYFSTTITNPEPMGKQGRVLHPEQHRVVSVRECARSQGFPDSYRFYGNILDRHRQIGNAVPPPLAAAIGLEIKKSISVNKDVKVELKTLDYSNSTILNE